MTIDERFLDLLNAEKNKLGSDPYDGFTAEQECFEFGSFDGCHLDCPVFLCGECEAAYNLIEQLICDEEINDDVCIEDAIETYDYFVAES